MTHIRLCLLVICAIMCSAAAWAENQDDAPAHPSPNVIVVCVDTLRADHLGVYGYRPPTSPRIDAFAENAWVFEQAIAPSSYTRETIASLFTAQFPARTPWTSGWSAMPPPDAHTISHWFREAGYHTALFSNTPMFEGLSFYEGFDIAECLVKGYGLSGLDMAMSERVLEHTATMDGEPFFLYLHYLDPHGPYNPGLPYLQRMGGPSVDTPLALYEEVRGEFPERIAEGFDQNDPRFRDLVERYDAEIAMVDDAFGQLLDGLESQGKLENTVIVLVADHGEEFLEHGFVEHAWRVFRESVHVPFIVRIPGMTEQRRVDAPVSLVDVGPTVARLAGVDVAADGVDGVPLLRGSDAGGWEAVARPLPIVSEVAIQTRTVVRALYGKQYVYMAAQRWLSPEASAATALNHRQYVRQFEAGDWETVSLDAPFVWEALYRFPGPQEKDLLTEEPALARKYGMLMRAYLSVCPEPMAEPERIRIRSADTDSGGQQDIEEQLEALGYLGG